MGIRPIDSNSPQHSMTQDTAKLTKVEKQVNQVATSQTLKPGISQKAPKGTQLDAPTKGVVDFLSGNGALYRSFLTSVQRAQRSI